jgi:hypothetical protein
MLQQSLGLLRRDPRGESANPTGQQLVDNGCNRRSRFPFAEDDFRKAAAALTIEIKRDSGNVLGLGGFHRRDNASQEVVVGQLPSEELGGEAFEVVGGHK